MTRVTTGGSGRCEASLVTSPPQQSTSTGRLGPHRTVAVTTVSDGCRCPAPGVHGDRDGGVEPGSDQTSPHPPPRSRASMCTRLSRRGATITFKPVEKVVDVPGMGDAGLPQKVVDPRLAADRGLEGCTFRSSRRACPQWIVWPAEDRSLPPPDAHSSVNNRTHFAYQSYTSVDSARVLCLHLPHRPSTADYIVQHP